MVNSSTIKRTYDTIALVALLNMGAAAGILLWLVGSGAVNGEKIQRIAAVMRGEDQSDDLDTDAEQVGATDKAKDAASELPSVEESQRDAEIVRREADRIKEELRQRLALNNSILLRVTTERESFKKEREASREQAKAAKAYRETEGFTKQVAIYDSLTPKTAVEHLLGLDNADEAARILLVMKTRQAKKIIEAAKRGDQRQKMMVILQRLREVSPGRSMELAAE
jgi:flagellar motility protein MotE (MotC chaperone)